MAEYKTSIVAGATVAVIAVSVLAAASIYFAPAVTRTSFANTTTPFSGFTTTYTSPTTIDYNLTTTTSSPSQPLSYCGNPCTILIQNSVYGNFFPVVVALGTNVTWINLDGTVHTVTSNTGLFASPILNPNKSFSYYFNQLGNFSYHCEIHPMTGTVIVETQSEIDSQSNSSVHTVSYSEETQTQTAGSQSITILESCTNQVTIGSTAVCAAPLNYTQFQQFVNKSVAISNLNGTIILWVGYNPCAIWAYVLPNSTDVEVYLGTPTTSDTC